MTDLPVIEIRVTPEFQRKLRTLAKKYCQIQTDIQPILAQLQAGEQVGDKLTGIGADVFKARVRNSDAKRGKSGGYRLIYWIQLSTCIILIDIYSKSEQDNIEVAEIQPIIAAFERT